MSAMLISSHPEPVRTAIDKYRQALDADPGTYLEANNDELTDAVFTAAGGYMQLHHSQIAVTDSTTMGVGLVYGGLNLEPGQEILTTEQDYYVTYEATRRAAAKTGAVVRTISLYDDIAEVSDDMIVSRIADAITDETRVLALTWVHSSTGLKLPLSAIARMLAGVNRRRNEEDHVLFCVDGVHGFGCEDVSFANLGCDFLAAGCHKWLFGPRGTGIVAMTTKGLRAIAPVIPTFRDKTVFQAWLRRDERTAVTNGRTITPGGFKPFEHVWALADAFGFHQAIGRTRVRDRTRALATQLKQGLSDIPDIRLETPLSEDLSAGIVSFNINGVSAQSAVGQLRERNIVASVAPYAVPRIRLTPSIVNTPEEIETVLTEVAAIAS